WQTPLDDRVILVWVKDLHMGLAQFRPTRCGVITTERNGYTAIVYSSRSVVRNRQRGSSARCRASSRRSVMSTLLPLRCVVAGGGFGEAAGFVGVAEFAVHRG